MAALFYRNRALNPKVFQAFDDIELKIITVPDSLGTQLSCARAQARPGDAKCPPLSFPD
jgi:hypothetical protein